MGESPTRLNKNVLYFWIVVQMRNPLDAYYLAYLAKLHPQSDFDAFWP